MSDSADNCVFCAIIRGERPAAIIVETGHLLAFLDHRPLFRGHTLLVPKQHMRLLSDLPADLAAEFLTTAQRLERAIEDGLGVSGTMILVNNVVSQSVPHLHLHVIPREFKDGLRFWLGPRHPYNEENPAQAYADKIRGALRLARGGKGTASDLPGFRQLLAAAASRRPTSNTSDQQIRTKRYKIAKGDESDFLSEQPALGP